MTVFLTPTVQLNMHNPVLRPHPSYTRAGRFVYCLPVTYTGHCGSGHCGRIFA